MDYKRLVKEGFTYSIPALFVSVVVILVNFFSPSVFWILLIGSIVNTIFLVGPMAHIVHEYVMKIALNENN